MEATVIKNEIEKKKDDAAEIIKTLEMIPEEKKSEVLGIITGFALCAGKSG